MIAIKQIAGYFLINSTKKFVCKLLEYLMTLSA